MDEVLFVGAEARAEQGKYVTREQNRYDSRSLSMSIFENGIVGAASWRRMVRQCSEVKPKRACKRIVARVE